MSKQFAKKSSFPLDWPVGFPRYERPATSRFSTTLYQALENVESSLTKFGNDSSKRVSNVVISSNYNLSDVKPNDAGVAVWFDWHEEQYCIPIDRYLLVQDNLQAIYHCIEAKRTELRHGGVNFVKAQLRGALALPDCSREDEWRSILGYQGNSLHEAKKYYRRAISLNHTDKGGSHETASLINNAWNSCQSELNNNN